MDLLQDLVHVDGVALLPGLSALLTALGGGLGDGFLGALLGRWLRFSKYLYLILQFTIHAIKERFVHFFSKLQNI